MLQYFIKTIFNLSNEEDNIIYYELMNNKKIHDILSKKQNYLNSYDYQKCLSLINEIKEISNK